MIYLLSYFVGLAIVLVLGAWQGLWEPRVDGLPRALRLLLAFCWPVVPFLFIGWLCFIGGSMLGEAMYDQVEEVVYRWRRRRASKRGS